VVEALQALSEPNQLIMARRLIANQTTTPTAFQLVSYETTREGGNNKAWSEEAATFEAAILKAIELLDDYLDAPRGRLMSIFRTAGGPLGRRTLVSLLADHIELLTALKELLENYGADQKGKRHAGGNHSAADVADTS